MVEVNLSPPPTLERLLRRIDEISTLPHVALRLMEVANDPNSSASDLKQVLENDPALSARVLRYVNSAAYGMRTKITNLQDAIAYLGLKQLRNLTMAASVAELFRKDEAIGPYRRSELWRHMVSVGICAADRHAAEDEELRRRFPGGSAARHRHNLGRPALPRPFCRYDPLVG